MNRENIYLTHYPGNQCREADELTPLDEAVHSFLDGNENKTELNITNLHEDCDNHFDLLPEFIINEPANPSFDTSIAHSQHEGCSHNHSQEMGPYASHEGVLAPNIGETNHEHNHKHCPKCNGELEGFFYCKECKKRWID